MARGAVAPPARAGGFTYVELVTALIISAVLYLGIVGVVQQSTNALEMVRDEAWVTAEAEWAMKRVLRSIRRTRYLLLPTRDVPLTVLVDESVRDLVAMTLDPEIDRNQDGFADGDDDTDGRVDEDPGKDLTNDGAAGIVGIDDDLDLIVDDPIGDTEDDDESGTLILPDRNEDPVNGIDDDGDGRIDEDPPADFNFDGQPGIAGVDDDNDGSIDEGPPPDDDEDGIVDEDWFSVVLFRQNGSQLIERTPKIGSGGASFDEWVLLQNVSLFQVARVPVAGGRATLLDVTLQVTTPGGETVTLNTRVRVGSEVGG